MTSKFRVHTSFEYKVWLSNALNYCWSDVTGVLISTAIVFGDLVCWALLDHLSELSVPGNDSAIFPAKGRKGQVPASFR